MGNQGSALNDEPVGAIAQRNLQHFDHTFKASLHTVNGFRFEQHFGECKSADRPITVTCTASGMDLVEDRGITSRTQTSVNYAEITGIGWDHANSQLKLDVHGEDYVILTLSNSVEFEAELKLRLSAAASSNRMMKIPSPLYIGMFAGSHKPKPFQRKRPNVSKLPAGKLPSLATMRSTAMDLHVGTYKPCPQGESRRMQIALQHIYEGANAFAVTNVRGPNSIANQHRPGSVIVVSDEMIQFKPIKEGTRSEDILFDDIKNWDAVEQLRDSGIEFHLANGDNVFFGVEYVRDIKHTLEYFWNTHKIATGRPNEVKLGSTHGRPIVTVQTLAGEVQAPEPPVGQVDVVDIDGMLARPGGRMAPRKQGLSEGFLVASSGNENKTVPLENREVKKHWHKVVLHQGWLLKQGGVGVGSNKQWIKRYFVLYKTSQGHFLVYYGDFTECPMYTKEQHHRNIVDLAKTTFIRPGSNKQDNPDTPPHCFDIVTTEREWTLCAETQENAQRWLQLLTRAVDEDVAILPDEELTFNVKPKLDPMQVLPATDYSTTLRVSAHGISVCVPDKNNSDVDREVYFWVYTDFYKWSLICPDGKLALLINVFADSSFSRRNEYVFRTKEASRLATAIEYFIEKFMSVMHISLETVEGAFDEEAETKTEKRNDRNGGLHELDAADVAEQNAHYGGEVDLLNLDNDLMDSSPLPSRPTSMPPPPPMPSSSAVADPFGDDPFGAPVAAPPRPQSVVVAPVVAVKPANNTLDIFGDDPFGSDPFGSSASTAVSIAPKIAPPLSDAQKSQHSAWLVQTMGANQGPVYDDGCLRISAKIEVKLSQIRLSLAFNNNSGNPISDLSATLRDSAQLTRFEAQPLAAALGAHATAMQVVMIECMKPASPGLSITVSYTDAVNGKRENTLALPVLVSSFNEPLNISAQDFQAKWSALSAAGQEVMQVIRPTMRVSSQSVQSALTSTLKFSKIAGMPDGTDYVLYGAASLRTGAKSPNGDKISVGSLVKIEINVEANALRVTLRTVHPAATSALMDTIKFLFQ